MGTWPVCSHQMPSPTAEMATPARCAADWCGLAASRHSLVLQAAKAQMDSLEAADAARRETARAKNDLEAFILAMQVGTP